MEALGLTVEMVAVLCLLAVTVFLFASEIVRVDVAAILILVFLGLLSYVPGLENLSNPRELFEGFSSNAVISIVAVMIIGAGLDKTGVMSTVARLILSVGGTSEKRIIPIVSSTVGIISSFMQNVGAAALFLPVISRISTRTEIPLSRLLMPMGFCAILGGTMTLVGSSPLILLNDLILSANAELPSGDQMQVFELFSVAPIGAALVATGILYFVLFGKYLLPGAKEDGPSAADLRAEYLNRLYGLNTGIVEVAVPTDSPIVGKQLIDIHHEFNIYIIALHIDQKTYVAPVVLDDLRAPCLLALMGTPQAIKRFAVQNDLDIHPTLTKFRRELAPHRVGVAELVIPPGSNMIGKSVREARTREKLGFSLLAIYRGEEVMSHVRTDEHEPTAIGFEPLRAGDTLVVHTSWVALNRLQRNRDYVIVTSDYPREELRPKKLGWAVLFFAVALSMVLFTEILLSLCLLTGAIGMIASRVLRIDEAYEAVGWNTVFLLASLIPLGRAAQSTGTAEWIANGILSGLGDIPLFGLQIGIAVLATIFTLIMSNVGATVLLVPLAINIAIAAGGNPAIFALTVAISTSNSFILPTHQVNALIMGPAGYRVRDFLRAGTGMTLLFLIVSLTMMNLVFS
ncbi:MAG: SLC13 family permease [Rhizobiaceae bacterium]